MCEADSSAAHSNPIPTQRSGPPAAVLKTIILFVVEYGGAPYEDGPVQNPAPRLLERGVRGRKLELEHFLGQHGVDVS
jgi:hypothetical protein